MSSHGIAANSARLLPPLLRHGFTKIRVGPDAIATLRDALVTWSGSKAFRHPPVPPDVGDGAIFPSAFNSLFDVCRSSLQQLDTEWRELYGQPLGAPLHAMPVGDVHLRGQPKAFLGGVAKSPFDASFFNLFNYDYGSLNAHKDRGLITVVYGFSGTQLNEHVASSSGETESIDAKPRSRLWLRDAAVEDTRAPEAWIDAEVECGTDHLMLFAGEQLELLTNKRVPAIEHCVRVSTLSLCQCELIFTRIVAC
jgi:hypothetical protein